MKKLAIGLLAVPLILLCATEEELLKQARKIHEDIITIDTHCDTTMSLDHFDIGLRHEPNVRGSGKQDLVRMKEGGLDTSFFAVYVSQGQLNPDAYAKAKDTAIHALDNLDKVFVSYPNLAEKASTPAGLYRILKTGKRAIFTGMENGYPIGTDLTSLDYFFMRGIRYVTLCHSGNNQFCDSATDEKDKDDKGLSDLGKQLVQKMNKLGILVDTSHISDKSFFDVLAVTKVPVFASHSSCRALCDTPRNFSDEMLLALKKNGGVIHVCVLTDFLKKSPPNPERDQAWTALRRKIREQYGSYEAIKDQSEREKIEKEFAALEEKYPRPRATVKDLVDHIDHVVKLIGINHVGIGTDFDGGGGIAGCNDVTEMPNITIELMRRGYAKKDIARVWGGNFLRVFQKAIDYAKKAR